MKNTIKYKILIINIHKFTKKSFYKTILPKKEDEQDRPKGRACIYIYIYIFYTYIYKGTKFFYTGVVLYQNVQKL